MPYIIVTLIGLSVWYPMEWVLPTLAASTVFFSLVFYHLMYNLVAGLSISAITTDFDLSTAWTNQITHIASSAVLIGSGGWFVYVGVFALPWVIVNFFTNVLSTLVKLEIVNITDKDD